MSATNTLEAQVLGALLGSTQVQFSTSGPFLGLITSPTEAGTNSECSAASYSRVEIGGTGQGTFDVTAGTAVSNGDLTFPQAQEAWGTFTHIGIFDASTGGDLLMYGALDSSVTIGSGDTFKVASGDFTITMD